MSRKGYDYFTINDLNSVDEMKCKVCGKVCDVKRRFYGATCFAEGMGGRGHVHDEFSCSDTSKPWHKQALSIVMEIKNIHSPSLKKIMAKDVSKILKKKKVI